MDPPTRYSNNEYVQKWLNYTFQDESFENLKSSLQICDGDMLLNFNEQQLKELFGIHGIILYNKLHIKKDRGMNFFYFDLYVVDLHF